MAAGPFRMTSEHFFGMRWVRLDPGLDPVDHLSALWVSTRLLRMGRGLPTKKNEKYWPRGSALLMEAFTSRSPPRAFRVRDPR